MTTTSMLPDVGAQLGTVSQIDAGLLNVGYVDAGPARGPAAVLLHGWPYDIHSYLDVVPLLTAAGYRVIVPHLRGYGTTRFLSNETLRNGEQAARSMITATNSAAMPSARAQPVSTMTRPAIAVAINAISCPRR
jgi:pimeloyl-ACP methyl ester carboxylesterase